jgi:hypothetical protein
MRVFTVVGRPVQGELDDARLDARGLARASRTRSPAASRPADRGQHRAAPQRPDVRGHVARPAEVEALRPSPAPPGTGASGEIRDTSAPHELVQHRVAQHEHAPGSPIEPAGAPPRAVAGRSAATL